MSVTRREDKQQVRHIENGKEWHSARYLDLPLGLRHLFLELPVPCASTETGTRNVISRNGNVMHERENNMPMHHNLDPKTPISSPMICIKRNVEIPSTRHGRRVARSYPNIVARDERASSYKAHSVVDGSILDERVESSPSTPSLSISSETSSYHFP